ncbi:MAG TPA: electron transfer flavoprotein subunit alpha/FixB family protein [Methylomirabilota bacterium]|nr:electron transfer flavoprotein subunit alpha/FixB family protein [Methylomirabilota bacterium]
MAGTSALTPVWVVAEPAAWEATLEALGEAVELARPGTPGVVAVGPAEVREALAPLSRHGAGRLLLLRTPGAASAAEAGCAVAEWLAGVDAPAPTVLLPHTRHGLGIAAQLTVRLDAALAPDAVSVRRDADGGIEVTRPAYGDRLYATVRVQAGTTAVVTLRPGVLGTGAPAAGSRIAVEERPAVVDDAPAPVRVRRVVAADPRTVDLRDAERIVAGGRGVGPDGFRRLEVLADLLGAAVGGSRVAVDLGWIPWERQIGQSGRTVAPELYLAFGISGASQHVAGIERARTVVAVNADRAAPLFGRAHLAAVADWQPVADALIERLRARRG